MKYLNKSFSSQPTNNDYRKSFPNSFPGDEPMGSSLAKCPTCGTYYARRDANICPRCGVMWVETRKNETSNGTKILPTDYVALGGEPSVVVVGSTATDAYNRAVASGIMNPVVVRGSDYMEKNNDKNRMGK